MLNLHVIGLESATEQFNQELEEFEADVLMSEIEDCLSDLYQLANFGDMLQNASTNIEAFTSVIQEKGISEGTLALIKDDLQQAGYYVPELEADGSNAEVVAQAAVEALMDKAKEAGKAVIEWIKKIFEKLMLFINKWIKMDVLRVRKLESIEKKLVDLAKVDKKAFDEAEVKIISYKDFEGVLKRVDELEKMAKGQYIEKGELVKFEAPKVDKAQKLSSLGWSLDSLKKAIETVKAKLDSFKNLANEASKAQKEIIAAASKDDAEAKKEARENARRVLAAYTAYSKALNYAYGVVVSVAGKVKVSK